MGTPVTAETVLNVLARALEDGYGSGGHAVGRHVIPPRQPLFSRMELDPGLLPPGTSHLYEHQAITLESALEGKHLTLATPTASGKTLAVAIPGLVARRRDPAARILCVVPTRALAEQWQERLAAWDSSAYTDVYTGDTPRDQRPAIRTRAHWLITTPDMLHVGILPHHMKWHTFLSKLRYVIVDEPHVYRGIFGSHVGHVFRRLRRVAAAHGATTATFLLASATIGNPSEHAEALLGLPVTAITESGAPDGGRTVLLWQPPDFRGHSDEAAALAAFFVGRGLRTILFGQARQSVERMLREVRLHLPEHITGRVAAYRAGYMPGDRRAIHRLLAAGELLGVVTTNALELGIDIGELDVSVVDGFPGSVASFWQQAGRAGRGQRHTLTVLVLRQDALDQYFAVHPERLFASPIERALLNLDNPYIAPSHITSAAHEQPLAASELEGFGAAAPGLVAELVAGGQLFETQETYRARGENPAYGIPLRGVGRRMSIVDARTGGRLEDTDAYHAVSECYPGAVYLSQGVSYLVQDLDLSAGQARVQRAEVDYYTQATEWKEVTILGENGRTSLDDASLHVGRVRVTHHVTGFVRRHQVSRVVIGMEELEDELTLPLETVALWITVPRELVAGLVEAHLDPGGSLHAAEHGLIALLPLFVMGDRRDVGGVSILPMHHQTGRASIFIHDGHPGGVGYAEAAYAQFAGLAQATHDAILACSCEGGCYACVQSPKCGNQNRPLDKAGAVRLLRYLLDAAKTQEGT